MHANDPDNLTEAAPESVSSNSPVLPPDLTSPPSSEHLQPWECDVSLWDRFKCHWERGLLVVMVVSVLGMIATLLWPTPQVVTTLKPYASALPTVSAQESAAEVPSISGDSAESGAPDDSALVTSGEAAEDGKLNAGSIQSRHTKGRHYSHPSKKPVHPPITNLNTAKLSQLQLLPGIGPKMAERVIQYRLAHGGFQSVEQIMDVKGIGPKKFEKMKPFIKI